MPKKAKNGHNRRKRQSIVLSPISFSPFIEVRSVYKGFIKTLSQFFKTFIVNTAVVLSPIIFSPLVLSPVVLGPVLLFLSKL